MSDIYTAPESTLVQSGEGGLDEFDRFSAWGVFGLTILTLGIYYLYWLYTRSVKMNDLHENKIPTALMYVAFVTYLIYSGLSLVDEAAFQNLTFALGSLAAVLVYLVTYLTWVFMFRSRLQDLARSNGGEDFKVNPILTFLLQVIYFQYKINAYIDAKNNSES